MKLLFMLTILLSLIGFDRQAHAWSLADLIQNNKSTIKCDGFILIVDFSKKTVELPDWKHLGVIRNINISEQIIEFQYGDNMRRDEWIINRRSGDFTLNFYFNGALHLTTRGECSLFKNKF